MPTRLRKLIEETIEQHHMLLVGDRVLVALSGGPDSVCLLHIIEELQSKYALTICLAHFNHKLRGKAAEQDAKFAEKMAHQKGLVFVTSSADVRAFAKAEKLSIEEAGRRLRYGFFLRSSLSLRANKIAVGHTADDQAETILMRLIRGAGPHGLAGIPSVRRLGGSHGPEIIRPLMCAWRTDIMRYIRARKLKYRKDISNESPEYLRNKIRLELLPYLQEEYNPQIKQRLASAASALAVENDFIETEVRLLTENVLIERNPRWVLFDAALLAMFHPALRKRAVHALTCLARPDAPMLEALHYADADALLRAANGTLDLPGKLRLEISEGRGLISEVARLPEIPKGTFTVSIGGATAITPLGCVMKTKVMSKISSPSRLVRLCTPSRQYFDLDTVRPPLEIRLRRTGDSFAPLGSRGSKKLKDFFIDKKVPRFLRDHIPILLSNGRIMWVMGYAIDKKFRLKPGSTAAFRVDYEKRAPGDTPE